MGAIIESIGLQNFYNYYGDYKDNTYHFKVVIILSMRIIIWEVKFYNGVLWIVEDEVYDADKRMRSDMSLMN